MSNSAIQIQSISFHNQNLTVLNYENKLYIAMKPVVENIGLDCRAQLQRIKQHTVLSKGVIMIITSSKIGLQEYSCLPLSMLKWLAIWY